MIVLRFAAAAAGLSALLLAGLGAGNDLARRTPVAREAAPAPLQATARLVAAAPAPPAPEGVPSAAIAVAALAPPAPVAERRLAPTGAVEPAPAPAPVPPAPVAEVDAAPTGAVEPAPTASPVAAPAPEVEPVARLDASRSGRRGGALSQRRRGGGRRHRQ